MLSNITNRNTVIQKITTNKTNFTITWINNLPRPILPIQAAVLNGFRHMGRLHTLGGLQIGNGAGNLKYRDLVHTNQLTVIGAFYDFTNDFGKGLGRVIIVNVNKKKRKEEIFKLPLFENIREENKEIFIERLSENNNLRIE